MSEPFIGQITMFAGNFAPRGWAFCDGQLLPIAQYNALFSILGTTYGGDGRTTFALPDLRGRVAMHPGHGPGLSGHQLGERSGAEAINLTVAQMPTHNHTVTAQLRAATESPDNESPTGAVLAASEIYANSTPDATMAPAAIQVTEANAGGSQPHSNLQPYQCVNFIIALEGIYPSRG
ncbi:MAG: tail fiber protein [Caldilineaceae bacterium]